MNSMASKCRRFFQQSPIYNPSPRYTLEEIAQRYAMTYGMSYNDVLKRLRTVMYGKEVA